MAEPLNVGIIGYGGIGKFHLRSLLRRPDVRVAALCDTEMAARDVAEAIYDEEGMNSPGPIFLDDWHQVIADPDIQAVTIALPNFLHREVAVASLRAGKHTLLEKPMARTYAEALEIHDAWEAARSANPTLVGMMVLNNNHRPEIKKLFELVHHKAIGEVRRIRMKWNRRWGTPFRGAWFGRKEFSGGGPLIDLAPHLLGILLELLCQYRPNLGWMEPEWLAGFTWSDYSAPGLGDGPYGGGPKDPTATIDVEDSGKIIMAYPEGIIAEVEVAWAMATAQEEMVVEVVGSTGKIVFLRVWPINDGDDAKAIDTFDVYTFCHIAGEYVDIDQRYNACRDLRNADPWMGRLAMVSHFADCALGLAEPHAEFGEALVIQRIIQDAYLSAEDNNAPILRRVSLD